MVECLFCLSCWDSTISALLLLICANILCVFIVIAIDLIFSMFMILFDGKHYVIGWRSWKLGDFKQCVIADFNVIANWLISTNTLLPIGWCKILGDCQLVDVADLWFIADCWMFENHKKILFDVRHYVIANSLILNITWLANGWCRRFIADCWMSNITWLYLMSKITWLSIGWSVKLQTSDWKAFRCLSEWSQLSLSSLHYDSSAKSSVMFWIG